MKLDFEQVREILPQKHPFLMIDKVIELEPQKRIVAVKNISGNEAIFAGHFPDRAIFPGAYIIEAMGQAGILLWSEGASLKDSKKTFFLTSAKVRFLSPVVPGDQLLIELSFVKRVSKAGIVNAQAKVGDKIVAKGELSFAAVEEKE